MTGMEGMKEEKKKERIVFLKLSAISSKINELCISNFWFKKVAQVYIKSASHNGDTKSEEIVKSMNFPVCPNKSKILHKIMYILRGHISVCPRH